jgi:hypothetical protein
MNGFHGPRTCRKLLGLTVLLSLVLVTGCKSRGSVSGKVLFKSQPVTGGYVVFSGEKGGGKSAQINPQDGTYSLDDLPTGTYKLAVQPHEVKVSRSGPGGRAGGGPPKGMFGPPKDTPLPSGVDPKSFDPTAGAGKAVPIPKQYQDPDTSGLTFEVKKGENKHDITVPES